MIYLFDFSHIEGNTIYQASSVLQGRLPSVGSARGVHHCLAALVDAEPVFEAQLGGNVRRPADFLVDDVLDVPEVELLHVFEDVHELPFEVRVVRYCGPNVIDHFLLLRGQHPPIEVVRVDGRHEHDPVSIEVVLGEIGTVPHLHLPVLIEADQGLIDGKGSKPPVELIEANQRLTEHIQTLLMAEVLDIGQPIGNILGKHLDVLVIGAEILLGLVVRLVNLDDRLVAHVPEVVSLELFVLIEARVVEDHVLLSDYPVLILVDLVVIVSPEEVPAEGRDGM